MDIIRENNTQGVIIVSITLNKFSLEVQAKVIHAYLFEAKSHRRIQEEILMIDAPARGGGFVTMQILHHYAIHGNKKGILIHNSFEEELLKAEGMYKQALEILKNYNHQ